jgi:hypothetical protein
LVPRVPNSLFSTRVPPRAATTGQTLFPQAWVASGRTTSASVPWFGSSCYVRDWLCISGKKNPEQGGWCMCLPMNKQPNLQSIQVRSNTTSCTTKRKSFFRFINGWVIGWHNNRHARFEWNCLWHLKINRSWWRIKKNTSDIRCPSPQHALRFFSIIPMKRNHT